jgi:subtilase family serine protease
MRLGHLIARAGARLAGLALLCGAAASAASVHATPPAAEPSSLTAVPAVAVFPLTRGPVVDPAAQMFGGYTPRQIRAAYSVTPLLRRGINGTGTSIVIVDSFGSPTIRRDLAVFDHTFGLRTPKLLIIHPAGRIPKFNTQNSDMESWAGETTLDVEWAHAMAPAARIVLVETPTSENEGTSGFPQIVRAEKYVLAHHLGGVISQSFGATEETFPKGKLRPLRGAYIEASERAHDVTVLAATGDFGATDYQTNMSLFYTHPVVDWPASDPLVTAVGGLDLRLDSAGRRTAPDQVWNDGSGGVTAAGGGQSHVFGRPSFQNGVASVVGRHRGTPDVSLTASDVDGVDVYQSFDPASAGWFPVGGTSVATPVFAGIVALADQVAGRPVGPINRFIYEMAAKHDRGIVDITRGNNTVSFFQNGKTYVVRGWNAVRGYDLSSGVGTVDAQFFVPELAAMAREAHQ